MPLIDVVKPVSDTSKTGLVIMFNRSYDHDSL